MQGTFQSASIAVLLLLSVSVGPWAVVSADEYEVDAPDYEQAGVDNWYSVLIVQNEDGSTGLTLEFHYADRDDTLDSRSDFRYQSDEEAYDEFHRSVNETIDALVRASAAATGRDVSVRYTGTAHTGSEDSVHYRFRYRFDGLTTVDGDAITLSEPLASNHPLFSREDSNVYVRQPNKLTTSRDYFVSDVSDEHSQYLIETDPDHDYPTNVELPGHEVTDFEGFSVTFEPLPETSSTPDATPTYSPTSTRSPAATDTSARSESTAKSRLGVPLTVLIAVFVALFLATALWARSES